jgi:hypothetical protein
MVLKYYYYLTILTILTIRTTPRITSQHATGREGEAYFAIQERGARLLAHATRYSLFIVQTMNSLWKTSVWKNSSREAISREA